MVASGGVFHGGVFRGGFGLKYFLLAHEKCPPPRLPSTTGAGCTCASHQPINEFGESIVIAQYPSKYSEFWRIRQSYALIRWM
jgi:hypothetical protein